MLSQEHSRKSYYQSPQGLIELEHSDQSLIKLRFIDEQKNLTESLSKDSLKDWLDAYFRGEQIAADFEWMAEGSEFERSVWNEVMKIPAGETRSYADIARALGDPNLTRAVGKANGSNPILLLIPCHRVIASNGDLTGYSGGIERKARLLDHERKFWGIQKALFDE